MVGKLKPTAQRAHDRVFQRPWRATRMHSSTMITAASAPIAMPPMPARERRYSSPPSTLRNDGSKSLSPGCARPCRYTAIGLGAYLATGGMVGRRW